MTSTSSSSSMVFPGIVRRLIKLMPTLVQAVALVVFIHIVGQVHIRLFKYIAVPLLNHFCISLIFRPQ